MESMKENRVEFKAAKVEILRQLAAGENKSLEDFEDDRLGLFFLKLGNDLIEFKFNAEESESYFMTKQEALAGIEMMKEQSRKDGKKQSLGIKLKPAFRKTLRTSLDQRKISSLSSTRLAEFHNSPKITVCLIINKNSLTPVYLSNEEIEMLLNTEADLEKTRRRFENSGTEQPPMTLREHLIETVSSSSKYFLQMHHNAREDFLPDLEYEGLNLLQKLMSGFDITQGKSIESFILARLKYVYMNRLKKLSGYNDTDRDQQGNKVISYPEFIFLDDAESSIKFSENLSLTHSLTPEDDMVISERNRDLNKAIKSLDKKAHRAITILLKRYVGNDKYKNYKSEVIKINKEALKAIGEKLNENVNKDFYINQAVKYLILQELAGIKDAALYPEKIDFPEFYKPWIDKESWDNNFRIMHARFRKDGFSAQSEKKNLETEFLSLGIEKDLLDDLVLSEVTFRSQILRSREKLKNEIIKSDRAKLESGSLNR